MVVTVTFRTLQARVEEEFANRRLLEFFESDFRRTAFISKNTCSLAAFVPLALALGAFCVVYCFATIVFNIQATIIGIDAYDSDIECERTLGKWLLVFGSLGLFAFLMSCCGRSTYVTETGEMKQGGASVMEFLASLAQTCWIFYGLYIAYSQEPELKNCNEEQWEKFYLIVNFVFYGGVAIFATGILIALMALPMLLNLLKNISNTPNEEWPLMTDVLLNDPSTTNVVITPATDDLEANVSDQRSVMEF